MNDQRLATASWADPEDFSRGHGFKQGMFWLGRAPTTGQALGYDDDRHVCLVSGSRSGKGTTVIVPNLCLWPGSVVVVDPKGENATVTAARRGDGSDDCSGMGQEVHVLDPFAVAKVDERYRSRFNPLDVLDPNNPLAIDDAGRIANSIVVVSPESRDPFWDQSARSLVKGLILHVLTDPFFEGRRNLVTVRQLITRGDHEGVELLRRAGETEVASAQALLWQAVSRNPAFNGVVAGIGESMAGMAASSPKQFESVLQVANRNTEFLDSPDMQACVSGSDFRLSDLKTNPRGVSVFLSLPQRYVGEHFRWLRMMITLTLGELEAVPGKPATGHRVLMCLDEFASLRRMEVIEHAVAQIAGFGVKLFFVLQSLEQLKSTYKDNWETFLSNAGLKLFFGLDDHFSRKYVSDFIGETELLRELATSSHSVSTQTTRGESSSSSKSWNTQESTGQSFSDNWKSMPFFLRNTAGFFAAISGDRQASRNRNTGTSTSDGGSDTAQTSTSTADGSTHGTGTNQSLHKRPLITPDEIGRYFVRLDDRSDKLYPGLGLVVITGKHPCPVQRINYFEDLEFTKRFTPHHDHPVVDAKVRHVEIKRAQRRVPTYIYGASSQPEAEELVSQNQKRAAWAKYEHLHRLDVPIDSVWASVLETQNYGSWMSGFGDYQPLPDEYSRGTQVMRRGFMDPQNPYISMAAVGDVKPGKSFEFHERGCSFHFELAANGDITELRFSKRFYPNGVFMPVLLLFFKMVGFLSMETRREAQNFARQCKYRHAHPD